MKNMQTEKLMEDIEKVQLKEAVEDLGEEDLARAMCAEMGINYDNI